MTIYPILFNQTLEQLRRIGARGGRATARNRRARQRGTPAAAALPVAAPGACPLETTAQAIATLDAQFPWLRQIERRARRR